MLLAVLVLLLPVLALFGKLEDRLALTFPSRSSPPLLCSQPPSSSSSPVADAALNGLTPALLGGGAACFALALLLLCRVPAPTGVAGAGDRPDGPLPRPPLSANVEP